MIWVIRSNVSRSIPLVRLTTGIQGRRWPLTSSSTERKPREGTPTMRTSAWRPASCRSEVPRSRLGTVKPGR
jgi:hypothetical protein